MISKDYRQNKKQVLALYEEYVRVCKSTGKNVNNSIQKQAEKIRAEIFNLMVLGEAKSGKSTFINAYLGKEVVPMDVRQCTSALIKIRRGDKFQLVAKTAAGGQAIVTGEDKIRDFLKRHATIPDKYRCIPVTTIQNEWLIKYKGRKIPKHVMNSLLESVAKDNIYNMDNEEYNKLICEYVTENAHNWGKIITEIELTYPLSEEMQGITIIDSPGVGAGGHVGKIAEDYIQEANAIIFVKSLSGQALESSSFMNFLRNTCPKREKESLFLVFTGKANLQGSEFLSLKEQAIELYKNDIEKEKILFVDSKLQLFLNKCCELGTEEKIDEYFDALEEAGNDFWPASKCWYKANHNISRFKEKIECESNFGSVQTALDKFARVANYLQLISFLKNLEEEYKRYIGIYSGALKELKENIEDPDALEEKITQKEKEINEVYSKQSKGINEIYKKYTDNINGEGIITKEAERKRLEYEEKLKDFCNLPESQIQESTFDSMKKMTMDAIDDIKNFRNELAKRVIQECNEKLIQYTDDPSKIPAVAYAPNFTEADFDAIDTEAKEKTSGYEEIEKGMTFKKVEKVPYHHLKQHVKIVADSIYNRLNEDIIQKMIDNIVKYVEACCIAYRVKLTEHKQELESEYKGLLKKLHSNEELIAQMNNWQQRVTLAQCQLENINRLKGELENYVGQ